MTIQTPTEQVIKVLDIVNNQGKAQPLKYHLKNQIKAQKKCKQQMAFGQTCLTSVVNLKLKTKMN